MSILESLSPFYTCGTTVDRIFNKWHLLKQRVGEKRTQLTMRYLNLSVLPETNGVRKLKSILALAEPKWMANRYNDFYIYTTQIPTILSDCKTIFSVAHGGKTYTNMFSFSSVAPVKEYITLPVDNDSLKSLPLGSDYNYWSDVHPLTLWWHTSLEQTFDLFSTGNLRFHNSPPKLVFWMLDIPALILKAVQFFKAGGVDINLYIKDVISNVTYNAEYHWYFKLQKEAVKIALKEKTVEDVLKEYTREETNYSYTGPLLKDALLELVDTYELVTKGNFRPMGMFSMFFYKPAITFSLMDPIFNLSLKYNLSHFHQYKCMLILRDIPYVDYIVDVYRLKPDGINTLNFKKKLKSIIFKWKQDAPLNYIQDASMQAYIKTYLNKWTDFANS